MRVRAGPRVACGGARLGRALALLALAALVALLGRVSGQGQMGWPLWLAAGTGAGVWLAGCRYGKLLLAWVGYYGAWMALAGLAVGHTGPLGSVWMGLFSIGTVLAAAEMPTLPAFLGLGTWGFLVNFYLFYATSNLEALGSQLFWVPSILQGLIFGVSVQNIRTLQRLSHGVHTDPLTGVGNRRELERCLAAEWERSRRSGRALSLLLIDLDHFKAVNDRYGHQTGDKVLVAVSRRIEARVRSYDTVCRYGGDEFAVILPDAGPSEALAVAERLRREVAELGATGQIPALVTISVGLASFPEHASTPEELIREADVALLREAKRGGRDRVGMAGATLAARSG